MFYVKQGNMPQSRHTYGDINGMLREELFGEESFDGPYSLLYHSGEPTEVKAIEKKEKEGIKES